MRDEGGENVVGGWEKEDAAKIKSRSSRGERNEKGRGVSVVEGSTHTTLFWGKEGAPLSSPPPNPKYRC